MVFILKFCVCYLGAGPPKKRGIFEATEMGQAMSNPCCGRERLDKDAPCMPLRRITALQDARVHFINDAPMMCILRDSLAVSRPFPLLLCPTARTAPDGDAGRLCRQREPNAPHCRQGAALRRRRLAVRAPASAP